MTEMTSYFDVVYNIDCIDGRGIIILFKGQSSAIECVTLDSKMGEK